MEQIFTNDELIAEALSFYMGYLRDRMGNSQELAIELEIADAELAGPLAALYLRAKELKEQYQSREKVEL